MFEFRDSVAPVLVDFVTIMLLLKIIKQDYLGDTNFT